MLMVPQCLSIVKSLNNFMVYTASDITDGNFRLPSGQCVDVNVMFCVDRG